MSTRTRDSMLLVAAMIINVTLIHLKLKKSKRKRSQWTKKWLQRREYGKGSLHLLNHELRYEDPMAYKNFLRLDDGQFQIMLNLVENDIKKTDTLMRETISAKHRLDVTLRFLATGETYRSLMYSTRIHESTISKFVPEVCSAIYKNLKTKYLKTPSTNAEWLKVSKDYETKWNFPHCLGALDGRHITFSPPISSGSFYYNYKGTNSIVLLALVDANYQFIYVNVGANGRISDGGVFEASQLCEKLKNHTLNIPLPSVLSGTDVEVPYVIIADDAFPLMENLMKPFPQRDLTCNKRIYNYRLSRARRMVESAFGILANRWRILLNPIRLSPEKAEIITLACVVLHNFLCSETSTYLDNRNQHDARPETNLEQIGRQGSNQSTVSARTVREHFMDYFNSEVGSVPWQVTAVNRGNM